MPTRNLRDATLVIKDNTATPNTVTVTFDNGDLAWNVKKDVKLIRDRGAIDHLRKGDEQTIPVSFSKKFVELTGAACTVWEMLTGTGNAAAYTYTAVTGAGYDLTDAADVKVVQLEFTIADPAGGSSEVITFPNCHLDDFGWREGDEADNENIQMICTNQEPIIT